MSRKKLSSDVEIRNLQMVQSSPSHVLNILIWDYILTDLLLSVVKTNYLFIYLWNIFTKILSNLTYREQPLRMQVW